MFVLTIIFIHIVRALVCAYFVSRSLTPSAILIYTLAEMFALVVACIHIVRAFACAYFISWSLTSSVILIYTLAEMLVFAIICIHIVHALVHTYFISRSPYLYGLNYSRVFLLLVLLQDDRMTKKEESIIAETLLIIWVTIGDISDVDYPFSVDSLAQNINKSLEQHGTEQIVSSPNLLASIEMLIVLRRSLTRLI